MKKLITIMVIVAVAVFCFYILMPHKENKKLVAYFSATGNTATVAQNLAKSIDADLFVIQPTTPYTADDLNWRNDKSRSSVEMSNRESRPEIATKIDNITQYDVIFVGFPIWWGREPAIIDTFIESYNLSGKTIVPFATSGSTPNTDEAAADIRLLAPKANVMNGKRFPVNVQVTELKTWADEFIK